jgi:hypothetical protein
MKEILQIAMVIIIIWGCILAAPILALVVGTGLGAWVLLSMWRD